MKILSTLGILSLSAALLSACSSDSDRKDSETLPAEQFKYKADPHISPF